MNNSNPEPPTDEHGPVEFESNHTLSSDDIETLQGGGTVSFWISTNEVVHLGVEELLADSKTEVCRYRRQGIHDDVDEWIQAAKDLDKVVLLDTENDAVFAYYAETDDFDGGYTWRTNGVDPDTGRRVTAHTSDSLVERRFGEAVSKHRAFLLDPEETPLREDKYVVE